MMFVMGMLLLSSCGKELPDSIKNYQVNKDDPDNKPIDPTPDGIPGEGDNPLPTY